MPIPSVIYPEYEVVRYDRCTRCGRCIRECANGVHYFSPDKKMVLSDDTKCVDCLRCIAQCPEHAIKIVKSGCTFRDNANWRPGIIGGIIKEASTGGVLLSSMGNPEPYPVYWDKIVINASQVTNPSIDPLREPMETRVFLGKKPDSIERDENGKIIDNLPPQLELSMPVMFSAMSYGSISYNAHSALAQAAEEIGTFYNTGEGGLHEDFYSTDYHTVIGTPFF